MTSTNTISTLLSPLVLDVMQRAIYKISYLSCHILFVDTASWAEMYRCRDIGFTSLTILYIIIIMCASCCPDPMGGVNPAWLETTPDVILQRSPWHGMTYKSLINAGVFVILECKKDASPIHPLPLHSRLNACMCITDCRGICKCDCWSCCAGLSVCECVFIYSEQMSEWMSEWMNEFFFAIFYHYRIIKCCLILVLSS